MCGATGTSMTAEFWQYDTRTGRRWNIDPVYKPWMSPYHAFSNNPISRIDPSGSQDVPSKGKKKETPVQFAVRTVVTAAVDKANSLYGGELSKPVSEDDATPYHLFYQWTKGTGASSHTFSENSKMGAMMLTSPEVNSALQTTANNALLGDWSVYGFSRSLREEGALQYALQDFPNDLEKNPARAFHGSFNGEVTVLKMTVDADRGTLVTMRVQIADNMSAVSGFRAPPPWGYDKDHPSSVFDENPYGESGQFRTIKIQYNMVVTVLLPYVPLPKDKQ